MQLDSEFKVIAAFCAELISAIESRSARGQELTPWERFIRDHNIDLDNPPYADGRHLKQSR